VDDRRGGLDDSTSGELPLISPPELQPWRPVEGDLGMIDHADETALPMNSSVATSRGT
jgi:hypothetical protein